VGGRAGHPAARFPRLLLSPPVTARLPPFAVHLSVRGVQQGTQLRRGRGRTFERVPFSLASRGQPLTSRAMLSSCGDSGGAVQACFRQAPRRSWPTDCQCGASTREWSLSGTRAGGDLLSTRLRPGCCCCV
jgi:hypothetical protein